MQKEDKEIEPAFEIAETNLTENETSEVPIIPEKPKQPIPTGWGGGGPSGGSSSPSSPAPNITPAVHPMDLKYSKFCDDCRTLTSPFFNRFDTFLFNTTNNTFDLLAKEYYVKKFLNSFHAPPQTGIAINQYGAPLVYMGETDWFGKTLEVEIDRTVIRQMEDFCRDIMLNKTDPSGYVHNTINPHVFSVNPDSQLQPIAFCYDVYLKSGNKTMLQEVEPTMVKILDRMNVSMNGTFGINKNGEPIAIYNLTKSTNTSLIQHFGGQWWDSWHPPQSSFSAYDNIYWYLANHRMSQIEDILNNSNATIYYGQSQKIKNDFNSMFWKQDHYVGWVEGGMQKDYYITWVNWDTIVYNLTYNSSHAKTITDTWENFTTDSPNKYIYPTRYGIMTNLIDGCPDGVVDNCLSSGRGGYMNGDHFFQLNAKDIWVRSYTENSTFALQLFKNYLDHYSNGHFMCGSCETRSWTGHPAGGTVFLTDAAINVWAFYNGIFGIQPYPDRIEINAQNLPSELFNTNVTYLWMNMTLNINFVSNGTISILANATTFNFTVGA